AHDDVDPAEHPGDFIHEGCNVAGAANVRRKAFRPCRTERSDGPVEFGPVASANRDPAAFSREFARDGETDTAGAACDQGNLVSQTEIHRALPEHVAVVAAIDAHSAAGDK